MIIKKVVVLVLWVICGYISWGMCLGSFTHEFPYMDHRGHAALAALTGPFSMFALPLVFGGQTHWLVKPYSTERRWQEFKKEFEILDREYFERHYN